MRWRMTATAAATAAVLAVGLFAPVAGTEVAVAHPVVESSVDGLPAAPADSPDHARTAGAGSTTVPDGVASQPRDAGFAVSSLSVAAPADVDVWLRTSPDGEEWTEWSHLARDPELGPDAGTDDARTQHAAIGERVPSMAVPVDGHPWYQLRVTGPAESARPEQVNVHLADTEGLNRGMAARTWDAVRTAWSGTPTHAHADVSQPTIIRRADWGADESLRDANPSFADHVEGIVVHHTGTDAHISYSESQAPALVRGIYVGHTRGNGWSDIGYNFLVDRYGNIYEGRHGGLTSGVIGAHAAGFNSQTVGIALIGQHEAAPPTSAALSALDSLTAWLADVHHIDPSAEVTFTSAGATGTNPHPTGSELERPTILGHRDFGQTACPGRHVYETFSTRRANAAAAVGDQIVRPRAEAPDSGPGVVLSASMQPSGSWDVQVTDSSGERVFRDSGSGSSVSSAWVPNDPEPDLYTWTITADGRRTATGTLLIAPEVLEPLAEASNPTSGSISISRAAFAQAGSAELAVLARDDVFADALAGGPLAGDLGPLLLTPGEELADAAFTELERVLADDATVYLLGGTDALSADVAEAVEAGGWDVRRLSGPERLSTAARIAEVVAARSGTNMALVARAFPDDANPWADALAGGAWGAVAGVPVLLTEPDRLAEPTADALDDLGITRSLVLGGSSAVSADVVDLLPNPRRLSGAERAGTAAVVGTDLWLAGGYSQGRVIVTNGHDRAAWTLALAAAPLAARTGAPLLLVEPDIVPPPTAEAMATMAGASGGELRGWVLGPESWISPETRMELDALSVGTEIPTD